VLQPLLSRASPDAETLALAAEVHLQDGNPAKAETYFLLAAKADPSNAKVQAALALAQISKGNAETGLAQLESLAAQGTDTLADLALISARMRRNEPDLALKAIDRLLGKLADMPLPFFLRGRILAQRKDWAGARANFEKALAVDPVYFPAVANLAAIDLAENKPDDARKRFESLLAREPANSRALLAVAELRQRAGAAPAEIGGLLADAVKKSPTDVAPRLALINHFLGLNNAPAARAAAQEAVAAMPENMQLLDALGRAQMAAGDGQLAISSFGKVAAAQPTNPLPLLQLADAYAKNKDTAAESRLTVDVGGYGRLFADQVDLLVSGQINSFAGTFVQIFLLMAVMWLRWALRPCAWCSVCCMQRPLRPTQAVLSQRYSSNHGRSSALDDRPFRALASQSAKNSGDPSNHAGAAAPRCVVDPVHRGRERAPSAGLCDPLAQHARSAHLCRYPVVCAHRRYGGRRPGPAAQSAALWRRYAPAGFRTAMRTSARFA